MWLAHCCTVALSQNVIFVGGSSGMGKAAALSTVMRGGNALLVSRNAEKLEHAKKDILSKAEAIAVATSEDNGDGDDNDNRIEIGTVRTAVVDVTDEDAVQSFASSLLSDSDNDNNNDSDDVCVQYDGLVFSAAGKAPHGPITTLSTLDTRELFETKFWGAYHCAKHLSPCLRDGGCIVFVSGVLNRRPGLNCSPLASTNGALEGLTRALALELGPRLRVNCLSPGFCDTERFDHMDEEKKRGMLENTADSLPLKRVGMPEDMGEAIHYLLYAKFVTGVVLDCDGGHHIRQYANRSSDPMRKN